MNPPPDAPMLPPCDRNMEWPCRFPNPIEAVKDSPAVQTKQMGDVWAATDGTRSCLGVSEQAAADGIKSMQDPAVPAQGGETPKTDIAAWTTGVSTEWRAVVDADFARTLERELNQALFDLACARKDWPTARKLELTAAKQDSERLEWRPIETAPECLPNCPRFMDLRWGPEGDQSSGPGIRWGDSFFAAGVFYQMANPRPYCFRETEVKPTHWRKSIATTREEIDAARREEGV